MPPEVPLPNIDKQDEDEQAVDLSDPLIRALSETAFVAKSQLVPTNLENVVEYQVLKYLQENGSTALNELRSNIDNPLLPVALRNLESSDLISNDNEVYSLSL